MPDKVLESFSEPVRLVAKQRPLAAPVGAIVQIPISAAGGKGKRTFELQEETPGLTPRLADWTWTLQRSGSIFKHP